MSFIGFDFEFVMDGFGEGLVQTLAGDRLEYSCFVNNSSSCDELYWIWF